VFISYSTRDAAYIDQLIDYLRASGITELISPESLHPGESWQRSVQQQIDSAAVVLVVMTPSAAASQHVANEIDRARRSGKPMVPLLLEGEPFFSLGALHYFDARGGSLPDARLLERLAAFVDESPAETWRPPRNDRSVFNDVLRDLKTRIALAKKAPLTCFISYAWGDREQEKWVEETLATDLDAAGLIIILDQWENSQIGASISRFVSRVVDSDKVVVVGTPEYRRKYVNDEPMRGYVLAAEADLIGVRMIGTEAQKRSVFPALLEGTKEAAFPPLLQDRIYADFTTQGKYYSMALNLIFSIYGIDRRQDQVAAAFWRRVNSEQK
jgi:hypothetical protein